MINWKITMSLVALALCTGVTTISTPEARADQPDEVTDDIATSAESLVSEPDDINISPYADDNFSRQPFTRDDDYNRRSFDRDDGIDDRSFDRDWYRHGYRSCYSYCDDIRDACMRRYYRGGYDRWRGGGRHHRWDRRHGWHEGYRRCERRFDYCLDTCRDNRGHR